MAHDAISILEAAFRADPVGGSALIDDVVGSIVEEQAELHGDLVDRLLGAYVAQQVAVAKRELARGYVSKVYEGGYPEDSTRKVAEWLSGIEAYVAKASFFSGDGNGKWEEKEHPRDALGRFVRGVSQQSSVDPLQRPINQVAPKLRNSIRRNADGSQQWTEGMTEDGKRLAAHHQAQYQEADRILHSFANTFGSDSKDVVAIVTGADPTGAFQHKYVNLAEADRNGAEMLFNGKSGWDKEINLISMEIAPKSDASDKVRAKVAQYNRLGQVGGDALARVAMLPEDKRSALTDMLKPSKPEEGALRSLFNRIGLGGKVMDSMGATKLGALSEFVGSMGPEVLTVMEPHVLRSSYRYRGTEKEPDAPLQQYFLGAGLKRIDQIAVQGEDAHESIISAYDKATTPERPGAGPKLGVASMGLGSAARAIRRAKDDGVPLTEDDMRMSVRSDVAADHLISTIPLDPLVAELSRKSGDILPSHGILIDGDGDLVSQAVGVSDDTYLPFDLRNMGRMRGGHYVRTRQAGGLTGEDIAASVRFGSRKATVVSSSGVFTLEFDPNFRGGRSMSLRAQEMYNRYLKILDAVENSGLYSKDIPPSQKATLRRQARENSNSREGTEEFQAEYTKLLAEARSDSITLTDEDIASLERQAEEQVKNDPRAPTMSEQSYRRLVEDRFDELHEQKRAEMASKLQLNAEGYRVALETLQQQFPYFIKRVEQEDLKSFLADRGQSTLKGALRQRTKAADKGYVRPGGLRASGLQSGFYQVDTGMDPKRKPSGDRVVTADGANGATAAGGGAGPTTGAPAPDAPSAPPTDSGGGGTQAPPAAPAQAGGDAPLAAKTPLVESLRGLKYYLDERGTKANTALKSSLNMMRLSIEADLKNDLVAPGYSDDMGNDALAFRAMLLGEEGWDKMSENERNKTLFALMDVDAVKGAMQKAGNQTAAGGIRDWLTQQGKFFGATDEDGVAQAIAIHAQTAADAHLLAEPFTAEKGGGKMYAHTGPRAQMFAELRQIDDPQKLKAHVAELEASGSQIPAIAREISASSAGAYAPILQMSQRLSDRVAIMDSIPEIQSQARRNNQMPSVAARIELAKKGIDERRANEALVWFTGTADPTKQSEEIKGYDFNMTATKARSLQYAYSLAMTARAIEANRALNEGGDGISPKDPAARVLKADSSPERPRPRSRAAQEEGHTLAKTRALLGLQQAQEGSSARAS